MKSGDAVTITFAGKTVDGWIMLASANEVSLMLGFEDALWAEGGGMFIGSMPVLRGSDGIYRDLIHNQVVRIHQKSGKPA